MLERGSSALGLITMLKTVLMLVFTSSVYVWLDVEGQGNDAVSNVTVGSRMPRRLCKAISVVHSKGHNTFKCFGQRAPDNRTEGSHLQVNLQVTEKEQSAHRDACKLVKCRSQQVCRTKNGHPRCSCRVPCSRNMRRMGPVCGSDQVTYKSLCALRRTSCRKKKEVHFVTPWPCPEFPPQLEQSANKTVSDLAAVKAKYYTNSAQRHRQLSPKEDPLKSLEDLARSSPPEVAAKMLPLLFRYRVRQYVRQHNLPG